MKDATFGKSAESAGELEVFEAGEVAVEVRFFGDVAEMVFEAGGVIADVLAVEENPTLGGVQEAGHHFHGGGLAGAVGAEIAGDLAWAHGEGDMVDDGLAAKSLGQIADLEHGQRSVSVRWSLVSGRLRQAHITANGMITEVSVGSSATNVNRARAPFA